MTQAHNTAAGGRFNWFSGVFTPSILTVLGVVMYLRLGWTTGQAGLGMMLIIVVITHLITGATALSVSSIATNIRVGAGGAYAIITQSLGLAEWAAGMVSAIPAAPERTSTPPPASSSLTSTVQWGVRER